MNIRSTRRTLIALVATATVTLGIVVPSGLAHADPPTPDHTAGKPLGIVPPHNSARPGGGGSSNLVYHSGGAVQTGTHTTYAIYWGSTFSTNYQSIINGYFGNVAHDSNHTSNVYYSDTQYYQTIGGATTTITYSENFAGAWQDTALPATSDCTSTAGGPLCVSDAAMQKEVAKAIAANHWPAGLGAEYFVFLADGVSTCSGSSCAFTQFCAYHTHYVDSASQDVLYANMPYTGHNLSACGGGNYPNGDAAADATLSVTSHEANETITDALGNAWYDLRGNENGDKCAWDFGASTGPTGAQYNQTINGAHYELQQEWSNNRSGCVLTGT